MNEHSRRTCKVFDGVYWRGAEVPCIWCGCQGKPALPPSMPSGTHTYRPDEDDHRNVPAA